MLPLGFLGSGNMAEAIARAVLSHHLALPTDLLAADPVPARRDLFASLGIEVTPDNRVVAARAKTLLLSCKPQQMKDVLDSIRDVLPPSTLLVSIAAGVSTTTIARHLGRDQKVIRVMPNTPLMIGEGMSALAPGTGVSSYEIDVVRNIFASSGRAVQVTEDLMDAVTAVSGSGPAYYFLLTEHLAKAAVELGLDPDTAQTLARQTALGAALMLAKSPDSPEELRRKVTSPGGTTQAAIEHMEKNHLPQSFRDAVSKARDRGQELSGT